jgi:hypothetical protein
MFYDKQGSRFSGERYIEEADEATGGSAVMLYVQYAGAQCDVFTVIKDDQSVADLRTQKVKFTKK